MSGITKEVRKTFVLSWVDDDIHVEYPLSTLTIRDVKDITNTIGVTPTCKYKDYTFCTWEEISA